MRNHKIHRVIVTHEHQVAGVISGAGGVNTGLTLSQEGLVEALGHEQRCRYTFIRYISYHHLQPPHVVRHGKEIVEVPADLLGGQVTTFPPTAGDLDWADVVVSATGASEPIIGGEAIMAVLKKRRHPLLLLDLAVPRDVEPVLGKFGDVYLYTVDDFNELVAANLKTREKEARRAEQIVEKHVDDFVTWYRENRVAPTIQQLHVVRRRRPDVGGPVRQVPVYDGRARDGSVGVPCVSGDRCGEESDDA